MNDGSSLIVTPSSVADLYARVQNGATEPAPDGSAFGNVMARALQGVVDAGHNADTQAMQAIAGKGNLTDVVTAVSHAELALQTALSIRDRVVQAYQEVSRMAI